MHPGWSIHVAHKGRPEDEKLLFGSQAQTYTKDKVTNLRNDFWFCTSPEIFQTRCFCPEEQYQTLTDFLALPDLRQGFYSMRFSLLSENICELKSSNGKCNISLLADIDYCRSLEFYHELVLQKEGDHDKTNDYMKQLVLSQVVNINTFIFEVRLPQAGTYWFRLFVNSPYLGKVRRKCCEFKIICNKAYGRSDQNKTVPKGLNVFGFTIKALDYGLFHTPNSGGKIIVEPPNQPEKQTLVSVSLDEETSRDIEYDSEMYGSDSLDETLTGKFLILI